jgi:hypothetical protein
VHDESKTSYNKGNFKEFVECLAQNNPALAMALTIDAADNSLMTSLDIQKDPFNCFTMERSRHCE